MAGADPDTESGAGFIIASAAGSGVGWRNAGTDQAGYPVGIGAGLERAVAHGGTVVEGRVVVRSVSDRHVGGSGALRRQ